MRREVDVLIIGGGSAGMAAAVAARSSGARDVVIMERESALGGILNQCIHNSFGLHRFDEELTGPEYAARDVAMIAKLGIETYVDTTVLSITSDRQVLAVSPSEGMMHISADAIVLAMGCRERPRGALNIAGTRPSGIYTAGCAQDLVNLKGALPGREVVILGSGDIGLIMARRLTYEGAHVKAVLELMHYSGGLKRNIVQCLDDYGIPLLLSHTITCCHGTERLEGVTVARVDPDTRRPIAGSEEFMSCDTLLLSVGLIPENELTRSAGIEMDPVTRGARVDETLQTSAPGIFAAGNVLHVHDLVDYVSEEGERAGRSAAAFVKRDRGEVAFECEVHAGEGIRYVVPQKLTSEARGDVVFRFRSDDVYHNVTVSFLVDGVEISRIKRAIVVPGEMETFVVAANDCAHATSIEIRMTRKEER